MHFAKLLFLFPLVSGSQCLKSSFIMSKERALEMFPMLKRDKLKGAIVYYDGSHNDARMNVSLAITSARHGANVEALQTATLCDCQTS